ncbi:MAG: hypothetical protein WBG43_03565 [Marinifilaceae bacterium]
MFGSKNLISLSIFLIVFISCVGSTNSKKIKAGVIDYSIEWQSNKSSVLPHNMRLLYSETGYCVEFGKIMSFIGTRFSYKFKSDSLNFMLDLGSVGTYAKFPSKNISLKKNKFKVKKLSERKTIMNHECKAVKYTSLKGDLVLNLYYSEKLNIDVVNRMLPSIKTKGAVLGIEIISKKERVYIHANKISEQNVDSDLFIVPDNYSKNSYKEILSVLKGVVK